MPASLTRPSESKGDWRHKERDNHAQKERRNTSLSIGWVNMTCPNEKAEEAHGKTNDQSYRTSDRSYK